MKNISDAHGNENIKLNKAKIVSQHRAQTGCGAANAQAMRVLRFVGVKYHKAYNRQTSK